MILNLENPKESMKKYNRANNVQVVEYKVNIQKLIAFL